MSEIYNHGYNILENFDILPMFSAQVKWDKSGIYDVPHKLRNDFGVRS